MNLTHKYPECTRQWERCWSRISGVLFQKCELCGAAVYQRPEDAERVSHEPEDTLPLLTPEEAENRYRKLLGWALGIPEDAELPT